MHMFTVHFNLDQNASQLSPTRAFNWKGRGWTQCLLLSETEHWAAITPWSKYRFYYAIWGGAVGFSTQQLEITCFNSIFVCVYDWRLNYLRYPGCDVALPRSDYIISNSLSEDDATNKLPVWRNAIIQSYYLVRSHTFFASIFQTKSMPESHF